MKHKKLKTLRLPIIVPVLSTNARSRIRKRLTEARNRNVVEHDFPK